MENKIELSIIIPVYNVEKYIVNCLKSIYSNRGHNLIFEVILINDGSTDNSLKHIHDFINEFNYKNLKLISQENRGASEARNKGLDNSKGENIWFIDADDYIEKDSLSTIENHLESPDSDYILKFNYNVINNEKIIKNRYNHLREIPLYFEGYEFVLRHNPSFLWTTILKSSIIEQYNLRFIKGIKNIEDLEFNTRYFYYYNKVKQIDKVLYNYVDNGNSTSRFISDSHLLKLANDSYIVHKSLKEFSRNLDGNRLKIIRTVVNQSVIGFFYSMFIRPYKFKTVSVFYNKYFEEGFLPIDNFENMNFRMKLFGRFLNSKLFKFYFSVFKRK
ncbi:MULTISPECIES: glycosyltransferase family 2 protein [unclassified Empedobacter]|uniref:glycosyltransferase family 2 protein n=1 Tax=unclassified Empedobacter TaxID=2643773 RepID=UPI00244D0457|nr:MULTISPECIES: glycosyltransferase [unclassified Empedobacter]MDH2207308.1 glycosyltransferase [Empedobacter sp. GD03644]